MFTVLAPSLEPPPEHRSTVAVNGGQRRSTAGQPLLVHQSTVAVNDGQWWRTTVDHCRTTVRPPVNHRQTTGQQWSTASQWWVNGGHVACHMDPRVPTWHLRGC
ncbi:hypothetical protein Tco_0706728 [Tanacetum coccineum]|uniref:Uncharacterized protein n=1 Tax=Tanacetum coccineum TaxID=301880 RepID=A0ABQ4YAI1_9ASTR